MNRIFILTGGDVVFWGLFALIIVTFVVMVAYVAGYNAGVRAHREFLRQRDAADMADTAAEFGPLTTALASRPGEASTLRRIK